VPRPVKKISKKAGLPPETLVHIGERKAEKVKITIIDYDEVRFEERVVKEVRECFPYKEKQTVTWINVDGLHDPEVLEAIGTCFEIHPLVLEDIADTEQRPKMEDLERYIFVVMKMLQYDETWKEIDTEQVSLILGPNFVISFQEKEGDVFDHIRDRIRTGKGRIRKMGADYLAYALTDAIVDNYFVILDKIGQEIDRLEVELVTNPAPDTLPAIHVFKGEMIFLRKSVWPLREVVSSLERTESLLVKDTTGIYLRDVYDHTIQVIDTIESYRDIASGMLETYLSGLSYRMNEIMKVLTIIATIFIPLTFVASLYGMNFRFMPELSWRWGYLTVLGLMAVMAIGLGVYFKRKRWL